MKLFKYLLNVTIISLILTLTTGAFALDQMAKEEITPPPAEGALSTDQIPPAYSTDKSNTAAEPTVAPSAAPAETQPSE